MNNIYDDTMNNNELDYEGNLVFPPQEESVEKKCEKLEKQLKVAVEALTDYARDDWWDDAVDDFDVEYVKGAFENDGYTRAQKALEKIKELDK